VTCYKRCHLQNAGVNYSKKAENKLLTKNFEGSKV